MRTRDLRQQSGELSGFIVSNLLLSRYGVANIASSIKGCTIARRPRRFSLSAPDDFCEFSLNGKTFLAVEPFGDNSEFWIVSEPAEDSPELALVRETFERRRVLFGVFSG